MAEALSSCGALLHDSFLRAAGGAREHFRPWTCDVPPAIRPETHARRWRLPQRYRKGIRHVAERGLNRYRDLAAGLDSILEQTIPPLEAIATDNDLGHGAPYNWPAALSARLGERGNWWTRTEASPLRAWCRQMIPVGGVNRRDMNQHDGHRVRRIRD